MSLYSCRGFWPACSMQTQVPRKVARAALRGSSGRALTGMKRDKTRAEKATRSMAQPLGPEARRKLRRSAVAPVSAHEAKAAPKDELGTGEIRSISCLR